MVLVEFLDEGFGLKSGTGVVQPSSAAAISAIHGRGRSRHRL